MDTQAPAAEEVPAAQESDSPPLSNGGGIVAPKSLSEEELAEQAASVRRWRREEYAKGIMVGLVVNAGNVSYAQLADQAVNAAEALIDRLER